MRISDWSSDVCSSDLFAGLGAVLCFNFDNIRYVTGTHIGEWARDKFMRYALCPADGPPFLWDPAPPAKRLSSPWISDNVAAPISTMQGGLPPWMNIQGDFAKQIKKALVHFGIEKQPLRSEEHTSELQSLMRISYAVFCLKK